MYLLTNAREINHHAQATIHLSKLHEAKIAIEIELKIIKYTHPHSHTYKPLCKCKHIECNTHQKQCLYDVQ